MKERLARTTWGREVKTVKQFFNRAVEMGWIKTNPFAKLKGSNVANKTRFYFVTLQEARQILDACPNAEMRLIFSLARFAGLRIPSELKFMEWSDISLSGDRFIVRIPKATNRKAQEAGQALTSRFAKILKRAGIAKWPKFFQNMRSTRDTELRRKYPEQDVNLWLGHTKEVALNHYMQTTDSLFSEASKGEISGMGTNPGVKIWQKVQFIPENTGS
ncbi:MAG: site-specific integrase, partial [Thermoguttaceae bacterium]|nr:site-specific integrase [Thermoguttaceae bacterium]